MSDSESSSDDTHPHRAHAYTAVQIHEIRREAIHWARVGRVTAWWFFMFMLLTFTIGFCGGFGIAWAAIKRIDC
jgi:hypothetical protein